MLAGYQGIIVKKSVAGLIGTSTIMRRSPKSGELELWWKSQLQALSPQL